MCLQLFHFWDGLWFPHASSAGSPFYRSLLIYPTTESKIYHGRKTGFDALCHHVAFSLFFSSDRAPSLLLHVCKASHSFSHVTAEWKWPAYCQHRHCKACSAMVIVGWLAANSLSLRIHSQGQVHVALGTDIWRNNWHFALQIQGINIEDLLQQPCNCPSWWTFSSLNKTYHSTGITWGAGYHRPVFQDLAGFQDQRMWCTSLNFHSTFFLILFPFSSVNPFFWKPR